MKKLFILLIVSIIFCSLCYSQERNYNKHIQFIHNLSDKFILEVIGNISDEASSYPIYKISYNYKTKNSNKYLIICGVHGNEPAPVLAIKEFIINLDQSITVDSKPAMDFIYVVNPWGFNNNSRYNKKSIDINRDFISLKTVEAEVTKNAIALGKYDCVFDFHEGNTKGYYLYYYSKNHIDIANKIIDIYKHNSVPIENEYIDVRLKTKNGLIFVPWHAKIYMELKDVYTTTLYSYDIGVKKSYTIESSKNRNIDERIRVIKEILKFISESDF